MAGSYEAIMKTESITIVLKTIYPKTKRRIFCMNCGGYLFSSYKQITMIINGAASETEVVSEIYCSKCRTVYEIC